MTTKVIIEANHGWPVDVTGKNPVTGEKINAYGGRVPATEKREFIVHSGMDLLIHEVQPAEIEAEAAALAAAEQSTSETAA